MKTKVAIVIEDFSTWGGVEVVVNQLVRTKIPFWGMIGFTQKCNPPKTIYPPHIELCVLSDKDSIVHKLKENNITHCIIISFELGKVVKLIELLNDNHIKPIYFFHNTPFIYAKYFIDNKFSILKRMYIDSVYYIKRLLRIHRPSWAIYSLEKIINESHRFLVLSERIIEETKFLVRPSLYSRIDYMYNIVSVKEQVKPKENIIVFAGRLTNYKRAFLSVKTLAPVLKKYPDWQFYILGDGEEYDLIKNYLEENHIQNIHLCGKVDNVHQYLAKSKICLLYSLFEGLPTILLEAGMLENVLVSYNSKGGVPDIIKNNKNGFIVSNEKLLAKKIEFLIQNPDVLDRMGRANKEIFTKFEHSNIIEKWEEILDIPKGQCQ